MATFTDRFRELLAAAHVSHQTAAVMCGLAIQTVHYLSSGRRKDIEAATLQRIAQGFRVSSDWLLGLSEERPSAETLRAHVVSRGFEIKATEAPEDDVMADGLARQESFHAFAQWKSRSNLERTSEVVVRDWCAYVARLAVLVSPSLVALGTMSRS
jgi:transcriptional regulator with XRE-family HTH domain